MATTGLSKGMSSDDDRVPAIGGMLWHPPWGSGANIQDTYNAADSRAAWETALLQVRQPVPDDVAHAAQVIVQNVSGGRNSTDLSERRTSSRDAKPSWKRAAATSTTVHHVHVVPRKQPDPHRKAPAGKSRQHSPKRHHPITNQITMNNAMSVPLNKHVDIPAVAVVNPPSTTPPQSPEHVRRSPPLATPPCTTPPPSLSLSEMRTKKGKQRQRHPTSDLSLEIPERYRGDGELGWDATVLEYRTVELNKWLKTAVLTDQQIKRLKQLRRRIKNRAYTQTARDHVHEKQLLSAAEKMDSGATGPREVVAGVKSPIDGGVAATQPTQPGVGESGVGGGAVDPSVVHVAHDVTVVGAMPTQSPIVGGSAPIGLAEPAAVAVVEAMDVDVRIEPITPTMVGAIKVDVGRAPPLTADAIDIDAMNVDAEVTEIVLTDPEVLVGAIQVGTGSAPGVLGDVIDVDAGRVLTEPEAVVDVTDVEKIEIDGGFVVMQSSQPWPS
jgi:hypothetical protein